MSFQVHQRSWELTWVLAVASALVFFEGIPGLASDWPMRGKDNSRNAVSLEKGAPVMWQAHPPNDTGGKRKYRESVNILWSAALGSGSWGDPVVADGLIWVGTNNMNPRDPAVQGDGTVLMCFRERDGKFLYQYFTPRSEGEKTDGDWGYGALASSPLVEDDLMWFCTNRAEVVCLDIGPLKRGDGEVQVLWKLDMKKELGVRPACGMIGNNAHHCSIAGHGALIYMNTTNGRYNWLGKVPAPDAPSLICLSKVDGRLRWQDNSPGKDIIDIQHGSPLVVEIDGRCQVIMGQGDGWLRSFDGLTGDLIWRFDINLKSVKSISETWGKQGERGQAYFMASPVLYDRHVYVACGRQPESCTGLGRLVCIDPKRRGDISSELSGGKVNSNSGLVWEYLGSEKEPMSLTMSNVVIKNDLLIAPDCGGLLHCVDGKTGRPNWVYDMKGLPYGSPLIADDKTYMGTEEGEVHVLELGRVKKMLAVNECNAPIYASSVFTNGVLYVTSSDRLYAIKEIGK